MKKFLFVLFILQLLVFGANASFYSEISQFERDAVDEGLKVHGLVVDDDPIGKIVSKIYVYTKAPFSEEAGFLAFFDALHVNTKDHIIKQYLFQEEGKVYDAQAIRDSEIYLRKRGQVRSMAVIVPVRSKNLDTAKEVELLVVTRDLLTLRPTFDFQGNSEVITDLMVALGEHSIAGSNKSISAIYELKQAMHITSLRYLDPMLFGSRLELDIRPGLVFSRKDFSYDGFLGHFSLERKLVSATDKWGYGLDISYGSKPIIDFNGGEVRTYDIPSTKVLENIERRYRWRYGKGKIEGRRSFGRTYKSEIFAEYGINVKRPDLEDDMSLSKEEEEAFRANVLPKNELESFITLGYNYFQNQYQVLYDYNNFKLAEVKTIGPKITISADFSSKEILFSDHSFIRPEAKFSFWQPFGADAFGYASISSSNRFDGDWSDNTFKYGINLVSPKIWGIARIVFDGRLSTALDNRDNSRFSLGADNGVRGVKSGFYKDFLAFRTNLELRSAPLKVWIFHLGGVIFYDVGSAFKKWDEINATHTVGFGLRVLTPQVSSELFRIDLGFPVYGRGKDHAVVVPSFGLGQAF